MHNTDPNESIPNKSFMQKLMNKEWEASWHSIKQFIKIALIVGVIGFIAWLLILFVIIFIPPIHINHDLILGAIIIFWWITKKDIGALEGKIDQLHKKISTLKSKNASRTVFSAV
jgi:hypothetical protein